MKRRVKKEMENQILNVREDYHIKLVVVLLLGLDLHIDKELDWNYNVAETFKFCGELILYCMNKECNKSEDVINEISYVFISFAFFHFFPSIILFWRNINTKSMNN